MEVSGKGKGHNFINHSNTIINNIEILYPVNKTKDGHINYLCKCFCGNYFITLPKHLKSGNTKSCGCQKRKATINRNHNKTLEIIGKHFGFLEVLEFSYYKTYNNYRQAYYKCFCHNCKQISYHCGSDLKNNSITSCGCVSSRKETEIANILTNNNINFKRQFSFDDLKNPKTNYKLRFDFAIIKNDKIVCLIEYQGEQHYEKNNPWYSEDLIERDNLKKEYCDKNNIPLITLDKRNNLNELPDVLNSLIKEGG